MAQATAYQHIEMDAKGRAVLAGTRIRVTHLAMERRAYGWDAEEMRSQHPGLTLGQIYSALAYYYDHEEELNRVLEERLEREARLLAALPVSPIRKKRQAHS
jgi:uncharacterized protein (DUF433 family)